MGLKVTDVIGIMESIAPSFLAEDWDNVGLQVGQGDWPVRCIWVALDPTPDVMDAACRAGADLLITHHPLIFKPLAQVDFTTPTGSVVQRAALNETAVFAAHTNLDSAQEGLNELLARKIGLKNLSVLKPMADRIGVPRESLIVDDSPVGLGRIGSLQAKTTLTQLAADIKESLDLESIRVVGKHDMAVRKVAICTGSGGSLVPAFLASDVEVFISGDLTYHNGRLVESIGRAMIDIGHFASEHLMVEDLTRRLKKALTKMGESVTVTGCPIEKDPFSIV